MIQGVHADTVVFMDFDRATELVRATGWPWLGKPGAMSTREVNLKGGAPGRFRVRSGQLRVLRGRKVNCSVQLERPDGTIATLVRGLVTLTPVPSERRTRLTLRGVAARDLTGGAPSTSSAVVRAANTYARSLLESVATAMEVGNRSPRRQRPERRPITTGRKPSYASGSD